MLPLIIWLHASALTNNKQNLRANSDEWHQMIVYISSILAFIIVNSHGVIFLEFSTVQNAKKSMIFYFHLVFENN